MIAKRRRLFFCFFLPVPIVTVSSVPHTLSDLSKDRVHMAADDPAGCWHRFLTCILIVCASASEAAFTCHLFKAGNVAAYHSPP